jgi:NADH:ubiquinone oxidoreductase subunit 2 (subunit N)
MSLIGIPITGGFFAKFYVLSAALKSNLVGLAIILVLNSAVGAYYYLRIIVMMYMREPRARSGSPLCRFAQGSPLPFASWLRFSWACCRDACSITPPVSARQCQ